MDIELARKELAKREYTGEITYRGLSLDLFTKEELLKIVELVMKQCRQEVKLYQKGIEGYQAITEAYQGRLKGDG